MNAPAEAARFGSGASVRRVEDPVLVRGEGRYTDDVTLPGQAYIAFTRSDRAHARIAAIDLSAARAVAGVVAVFTGAEMVEAGVKPVAVALPFKRPDGSPLAVPPKRALAHEVVRYVGEAVVAVVADSREAAKAAAAAVMVDYEDLPAVADALAATQPGASAVWPAAPDNIAAEATHGDAAATEAAFAGAAHRIALDIVNQRLAPSTMEPRATLAYMDGERLTLRMSSQMPTGVRATLSDCIPGRNVDNVRVLVGEVGGGFGMKGGAHTEDITVAWAALQTGRPVKWQAERAEDFLSGVTGRDQFSHAEMALDANGKVLALRVRTLAGVGASASATSIVIPLLIGPWVTTSIYDIPLISLKLSAVLTNNAATGAYRGAGRPEAIYIVERLFDAAARELKIEGPELRRRNMLRPEQMPYKNPMAQVYDCGQFEQIMDQGLALADWAGFEARRAASESRGKLRGRGIATFLEWTGGNALTENVTVAVTADGYIDLTSATLPMGQGIATSYVQLAHDVFGVPLDRIRVLQGDTDRANGFGSAGSRSLFTGGAAVFVASQKTVEAGKELAAKALEAGAADIEYRAGRFEVAGTDLGIGLFDLAKAQAESRFVVTAGATAGAPSWPNGCHIAEVEVDAATGEVQVVAYASVNDIGRIVSPGIVKAQIEGGAVQGIGQALCERVVYDEQGQLLTASYMDYALPRADGFLGFKTVFDQSVPCLTNTLGAKGVGELGTIGATPAVVNAVVDAVAHSGQGRAAEQMQMPLTSEVVWKALHGQYTPALKLKA
jgi:carbon-monoxide dehydrogenase large subunit